MDIESAGMDGVGGLLRWPKAMRIEPHRSILYKATISDFLEILIAYERSSHDSMKGTVCSNV